MSEPRGVVFPLDPGTGRRSTTATGRSVVADALRGVDPVGAAAVERETGWRQGYVPHFRRLVEAGLPSRDAALDIARRGLVSTHERMRWADEAGEHPLRTAVETVPDAGGLGHEVVRGSGVAETALSLPYQGRRLAGAELRERLDRWVEGGVIEPSCAEAVGRVVDHPEWLRLDGTTVVVLGAAAEMGPLRSLLRWGATVAAVDLPRRPLWDRLLDDAAASAGTLVVPVRAPSGAGSSVSSGSASLAERAGADLLHDVGAVARWVEALDGRLVLGNYVYADGATNVRLSTAVDVLGEHVVERRGRGEVGLAFLATPTDVFAVPGSVVERSVDAYAHRRTSKVLRVPLRGLSGGRLLRRNYAPGTSPGINDSVVTQQGPNYLLAKRIQRWRAATHRAEGGLVSFAVAPPTRTRSVVKNRALAAAYAGAHRFGIEVFEPGTANTLMAALLVHDLHTGGSSSHGASGPTATPATPWEDEARAAAHGGLWTCAYDPRSALGLAALLGLASARP
ncbi:hypothetical protein DFJ68_3509 [Terracoccus luteus]|uniref:Uncharacterized protein n=1 Tax=Terracoccus luteus TaxID=53356 RepID=A0A495XZI9_9MICO|nr:hypothetical protein [Terracoccus luteus]RKT80030.1 hypothetical protein DFJ68_3509 [Terracoccus luteus]